MTPPRPPERPLPWILAAVIGAAVLVPPETDGIALAGVAALVVLASAIAATSGGFDPRGRLLIVLAAAVALAVRWAGAPGPAVLPSALAVLAVAAGLAAATAAAAGTAVRGVSTAVLAGAGSLVGARAVYEVVYGLRALAERVRADAAGLPDAEVILGRLEQGRAYAGFPTPAAAGGLLALALPVTVALFTVAAGRRRALLGIAAAVQIAGLLATRSLTAAAALLIAVAAAAVLLRSRRAAIAAGAVVLAVAALAAIRAGQVASRDTDDSPWLLRLGNVRIALAIAADHPWMGTGPGGYAEAFARYRTASDNESRHAHCLPAELLAELGIPAGLAAAIAVYVVFLGPMLFGLAGRDAVGRGVAIGVGAFALHNLADFTAFLPSVLLPAVILRGSLRTPSLPRRVPAWARVACAGPAALAGGLVVLSGVSDARLDRATEAARLGRADEAAALARAASRWAPWSADAALAQAQAEAASSRPGAARVAADRAVRLAPVRGSAREVRSRIRAASGDVPGAFADLVRAVELNPTRTRYAELRDRIRASLP